MDGGTVDGRTIVVTGVASGIGRAIALGFLGEGARVVACDLRAKGLVELADKGALTAGTPRTPRPTTAERWRAGSGAREGRAGPVPLPEGEGSRARE